MTRLRLALVGAGVIGRRHIGLIQESAQVALTAIVGPGAATQTLANTLAVEHHQDLPTLFARQTVDGVILATPNALHVEQALLCIEAGVPALIEKPVAHSVAEGERLLNAASTSSVPLLVGHHRAHSPILAKARAIIAEGVLGQPVAIQGSALFYKPDSYFDEAAWRREPGGGPVLINLIHEIGNLRSLLGDITHVQAMTSQATRQFTVEDTAAINFQFANGALGTFLLSDTAATPRSWEQSSGEDPVYAHYPDEECYLVAGTQGSLSVPTLRIKRYCEEQVASWWEPFDELTLDVRRDDPLACQLDHFVAVIRGEATPLVSVHDGLQNLRVVEAIYDAAATGRCIAL
jgi:predicted dehydrogenase